MFWLWLLQAKYSGFSLQMSGSQYNTNSALMQAGGGDGRREGWAGLELHR